MSGLFSIRKIFALLLALLGVFLCYRLIVSAASSGTSRFLQFTSIIQSRVEPADLAVKVAPNDPEAHYTRALALVNAQRLDEAVIELRESNRLRPHHYYQWLDLGVTLDRLGDEPGALDALKESVRLAPYYAQPRWQLGNLLYRLQRFQEAFAELRPAAETDPGLLANMIELAWVAADGDVAMVESLLQPQNAQTHLQLAMFLAQRGKGAGAAAHVQQAGEPVDEAQRALFRQTIAYLLSQRQFSEAYIAWTTSHHSGNSNPTNQFLNGDFLYPITRDDVGFGWQVITAQRVTVSVDPVGPGSGVRSLRLEFEGDVAPGSPLAHQMILTEPNSRYSLRFMAKAENLISGSPTAVLALEAGAESSKILGQSASLSPGTGGWNQYQTDFYTDEKTTAIMIAVERLACNQTPCPIFGKLWLGGFSLVKQ